MELTDSAMTVLKYRYLKRDPETWEPIETPEELCRRVARAAAEVEYRYEATDEQVKEAEEAFFYLLNNQIFIPNSPTLMNAGLDKGEWNACYVLPIHDTMESILDTYRTMCMVQRFGGGTGFDFSELRPKGDRVYRTQGVASGPVSFMRMYSAGTEEVKQGGRRRGANMAVLRCDHPDIEEFIACKDTENTTVVNFNISVACTDEFMRAVTEKLPWKLVNPRDTQVTKNYSDANELFDQIAQEAWRTGDPGVLFIDRANEANPTPTVGKFAATNPCGESWLLPNEACTLGSINLSKFVISTDEGPEVDFEALQAVVRLCVRFLDNAVDASSYATPEIREMHRANRKIGLGVMGFHDMLILLGIAYTEEMALITAEHVMEHIDRAAHATSRALAVSRGTFPNWDEHYEFKEKYGKQRNAHVTVIAPTGTISIIAGCSSGIEPIFAIATRRENVLNSEAVLYDLHPLFQDMLPAFVTSYDRRKQIIEYVTTHGVMPPAQSLDEEYLAKLFVTANEVPWEWHIKIQAAFQRHTDNAVSKTINMPENTSWHEIADAYKLMWRLGCKGGTIYRHNSKATQVLNFGAKEKEHENKALTLVVSTDRPTILEGKTFKIPTGLGNAYITVNEFEARPVEVFCEVGKAGSDIAAFEEALGRVCSVALQYNVPVGELSKQLSGIGGATRSLANGAAISVPDALGRVLGLYTNGHVAGADGHSSGNGTYVDKPISPTRDVCPQCGVVAIERVSRCDTCLNCGYSTC